MKNNHSTHSPFFSTFFIPVFFIVSLLFLSLNTAPSHAGEDHSELIETPFDTPQEVTQACLECHESVGEDFIETAHWLWRGKTPFVKDHESDSSLGKINLINDY